MKSEAVVSYCYPLKSNAGERHLVDQSGNPFLLHGDAAWSLISGLHKEEVERYLDNRKAKGFNAIIVNLIEHKFNGPENRYGEVPFTKKGNFTTPNENYFKYADIVMQEAAERDIVVFLAPIYLGYKKPDDDEGWIKEVLDNGPEKCREWGRYVGQRYGKWNNLVWMMGGDRNPDEVLDHLDAMVEGIKEYDDQHIFTGHVAPECSPVVEFARNGWVNLNLTYTYEIVHRKLLADYNRKPTLPFILVESSYEGEHNCPPVQIRRQAYWAVLCGASGQFMGNRPIWLFDPGWEEAMDLQGSRDMVHLKRLFLSRSWSTLIPEQEHRILTGGVGEHRGLDYTAAAYTKDFASLIAYMPRSHTLTVDVSKLSGSSVKGWWFDPRTGQSQFIGEFVTRGEIRVTPPGDDDWVLVLDDAAQGLSAPGI